MANRPIVTVTYDKNATPPSLKVDPMDLVLGSNAPAIFAVAWKFKNVKELTDRGWLPSLRFELATPTPVIDQRHLGPFTELSTTTDAVVGSGFRLAQKFSYRAMLLPPPTSDSGGPIVTIPAWLDASKVALQSSMIRVTYDAQAGELKVDPQDVAAYQGQGLRWEVDPMISLTQKWYPRVIFESFQSSTDGLNHYLGPFRSFQGDNALTEGLSARGPKGKYKYRFQLISENGEPLAMTSPDPSVDKEGDPSGDEGS